jgi:uncharacterized protein
MSRLLVLLLLALAAVPTHFATAQSLPARPQPFTFVTDQAKLLAPADAQKLDAGLRRYADQNGTQVVVVTVPSLGGRTVADYARALGNEWGVGQRGKNNGVVVLLSGQEHQVSIQAGEGLQSAITPAVTSRIINQQMLPSFKQGNYFAGLRSGLNTLLLAANPTSDPRRNAPAGSAPTSPGNDNFPALGGADAAATSATNSYETPATTPAEPAYSAPAAEPESSGMGMGTILIGLLVVGGIGFLLLKMFRRNAGATPTGGVPSGSGPDFYGNQPNRNNGGYNNGPGYQQPGSSGPGIGGILATGAAAAAGAYLGNRMASGHDTDSAAHNYDSGSGSGAGLGAGLGAGAAGSNYSAPAPDNGPDYFSDTNSGSSSDYFSNDSSYDDTSSGDTGGGGFDSSDDNSGSW